MGIEDACAFEYLARIVHVPLDETLLVPGLVLKQYICRADLL